MFLFSGWPQFFGRQFFRVGAHYGHRNCGAGHRRRVYLGHHSFVEKPQMNSQNSICPQCGTPNANNLKFCSHCGATLPENTAEETSGASNFWRFALQFILALAALAFGGVGACSTYVLTTGQAKNQDLGDISGLVWMIGIVALICAALCLFVAWCLRKK